MAEENISQEFRLKNIDETRNYLIEEINQNELMSKKHKSFCRILSYIEHSLIAISTIIGCLSISIRNRKFYNRIKNLCNNLRN